MVAAHGWNGVPDQPFEQGYLCWGRMASSAVDMLDQAQNRNLRANTGQLALTLNEALRLEAGVQSFGCLRDSAAAVALERSLRPELLVQHVV
jgi:hypothetical protein